MSKKHKGKLCVYCGLRLATTGDHIFARNFFLVDRRAELPQAPACNVCNREKSHLEHYLTAVLPFAARHADAAKNLQTQVPKRLAKNKKLLAELQAGFTGEKLPLRPEQVETLCQFIVKGLLWHHWQVILGPDDGVVASVFRDEGLAHFRQTLSRLAIADSVRGNLGEGTFAYEGIRARHYPQFTFWRIVIYGGIYFGDSTIPNEKPSLVLAMTNRRERLPSIPRVLHQQVGSLPVEKTA